MPTSLTNTGTNKTGSIVLDFFAGSGTTAHAIMQLNAESQASRKFIGVQIAAPIQSHQLAKDFHFNTIDEISRERIKRAAAKIREENPTIQLDLGFKHYRFVSPSQPVLDDLDSFDLAANKFINNKGQLTELSESGFENMISPFSADGLEVSGTASGIDTIRTTWLVADGYKFDIKVEVQDLGGYKAYYIDSTRLYLIDEGWGAAQTRYLLNQVGTYKLTLQTVVIYGYSFSLESIRELEIGLKQLEQKINLIKRY